VRTGVAEDSQLCNVRCMEDASPLLAAGHLEALRTRLRRDGFLLLRGVLERDAVQEARAAILSALHTANPGAFALGTHPESALAAPGAASLGLLSRQHIAAQRSVAAVLESPSLYQLAATLLEIDVDDVITPAFKWSRAVAPGEFTGVHCDAKYVGGGTRERMLTFWLPLGDVPMELGGLLVATGSHRQRCFAAVRERYLAAPLGADGTASGWLCDGAAAVQAHLPPGAPAPDWRCVDCEAGDVIVLRLDVLHLTACNVSSHIRTSCDTRWQPRHEPRDPRITHWRDRHDDAV